MKALLTILILLFSTIFIPGSLIAQRGCATEWYRDNQQQKGEKVSDKAFEQWLAVKKMQKRLRPLGTKEEPALIPVVVHVIHNGELLGDESNISEEQILSQIEVLNEDFQRENADTVLTPADFLPVASSLNIKFVLAKRDPMGNPTNGIVRKQGSKDQWSPFTDDNNLKAESYWPAEDYLNIWVCDLTGLNLGYAQFPDIQLTGLENEDTDNRLTDGVVMDYTSFGSSDKGSFGNLRAPYDKGRTTTHEVGHWLGLLHIFAVPGSCGSDDYVEDTPLQRDDYNGTCPSHPSFSCSTVDMFQNYMDYTNDECMNLFTAGQVERMQTVLDFAPRRTSLLNAVGAFPVDEEYFDLRIVSIDQPGIVSCSEEINPIVTIQNSGTQPVDQIVINYGLNGEVLHRDTFEIVPELVSGQQMLFHLTNIPVQEGKYDFNVNAQLVGETDFNASNNGAIKYFAINRNRDFIPYLQAWNDSDIEDQGWTVLSPNDSTTWEIFEPYNGQYSAYLNFHNYEAQGRRDWLVSPVLDFSGAERATLKFDLSYAKFSDYVDTLAIYVSQDCGMSYEKIYETFSDEMSILDFDDSWKPESEEDWKDITIDLTKYAELPDVRIAFLGINGFGNNLFLDNIEFFIQSSEEIVELPEKEILIFPNPVTDQLITVAVNTEQRKDVYLSVFDPRGAKIYENQLANALNQTFTIDLTGRSPGVYIVNVAGPDFNDVKKIVYQP